MRSIRAVYSPLIFAGILLFSSNGSAQTPSCSAVCKGDGNCILQCGKHANCIENYNEKAMICSGKYARPNSCDEHKRLCIKSCRNP